MPTIEQASRAFNSLPDLTEDELQRALSHAHLALSPEKQAEMFGALALAFRNYFVLTLGEAWSWKGRAAPMAAKLKQIAGALKRAEDAIDLVVINGGFWRPRDDQVMAHLALQANWAAPKPKGWPDLGAFNFSSQDPDTDKYHRALDYRGDEKVSQCLQGLALLRQLAESAHSFQRTKVSPKDKKGRHKGDPEMKALIASINDAWIQAFDKLPGVSWRDEDEKATGPYVRFVWTLFQGVADRVPSDLASEYPQLQQGLDLTEGAIRARFKRSAVGRIKALARRRVM
jgi:hypothetical protein